MRFQRAFLAAVFLAAFGLTGCNLLSPTEPGDNGLSGPDKFSLTATMTDTSGTPSLNEIQIIIDGNIVADSCSSSDPQYDGDGNIIDYICADGSTVSLTLSAASPIGPGSHTVKIFVSQSTQYDHAPRGPYSVAAFTIEVNGADGKLLKTISLPAQTAAGGAFSVSYPFTI